MIRSSGSAPSSYSLDDILQMTQPKTSSGFRQVLGSLVGGVGSALFPGIGSVIGGAIGGAIGGGAVGAATPTLGGQTTQYLMLQQQIEQETLAFQTASTILKVRHDAALQCIQNMK